MKVYKKILVAVLAMNVAGLACAAQADQKNTFDCFGTEPFWEASVSESGVMLKDPVTEQVAKIKVDGLGHAHGYTTEYIRVYKHKKTPVMLIQKTSCEDGMSENEYEYQAFLFRGETTLHGCCVAQESSQD